LRLLPEPTAWLAADHVYEDISFPKADPTARRPYVAINMVSSLDGKAATGGKAGAIGSPADRLLMRTLRARADAVMIGAGTLRAEKLTLAVPESLARARKALGLKPQPLSVVATTTGDLPLQTNLLGPSPENLLVLVPPEISEERLATLSSRAKTEVVVAQRRPTDREGLVGQKGTRPSLDLSEALCTLKRRYAVDVLLVEGGPALNHALISSGLADELFLTLAPKLLGGSRPEALTILEGPAVPPGKTAPELTSLYLFENELFLRYALHPQRGV
jgi:riboflavin-specific deaminase-like protein